MPWDRIPAKNFRVGDHFNCSGTYYIFFKRTCRLLQRSGYFFFEEPLMFSIEGDDLLYVGASEDSARDRVNSHLYGDSRQSSLRISIASILKEEMELFPLFSGRAGAMHFGQKEKMLSDWILDNVSVHIHATSEPFVLEREAIQTLAPPLNISHRQNSGYTKYLRDRREQLFLNSEARAARGAKMRLSKYVCGMDLESSCDTDKEIKRWIGGTALEASKISKVDTGSIS